MEDSLLTRLLIKHDDKYLKYYVLRFCYLSMNALIRSCKALQALIQPRLSDSCFIKSIVCSKLRALSKPMKWDETVSIQASYAFDPFFDHWPLDMPARITASTGQMLSWIWDQDLIKVWPFDHLNRTAKFQVRDWKRFHLWTWEFTFSLGGYITGFIHTHDWTAFRDDYEGDHWYRSNTAPRHICILESGKQTIFNFLHNDVILWTLGGYPSWKARPGYYLHGWCIPLEPLDGVSEWIKE